MNKTKENYKDILLNNGYINLSAVIDFLRNNCIADFEVVSDIFNEGMSESDYQDLQEAIDDIESEGFQS
ncbi:MAG: hypothetical protein JRI44_13280 [Deltaproteobacteria bacterium]|nr:hypothetical protein [Deltaproteobacteria bacterium]